VKQAGVFHEGCQGVAKFVALALNNSFKVGQMRCNACSRWCGGAC
jgi:hypothetical protein